MRHIITWKLRCYNLFAVTSVCKVISHQQRKQSVISTISSFFSFLWFSQRFSLINKCQRFVPSMYKKHWKAMRVFNLSGQTGPSLSVYSENFCNFAKVCILLLRVVFFMFLSTKKNYKNRISGHGNVRSKNWLTRKWKKGQFWH